MNRAITSFVVNRHNIASGDRGNVKTCPIALALQNIMPPSPGENAAIFVNGSHTTFHNLTHGTMERYFHSPQVAGWIHEFDIQNQVKEIKIMIDHENRRFHTEPEHARSTA